MVLRLNWLEKVGLRGCARPSGRQYYLLLITVVRVYYCTAKMLKETENKETRIFVNFLSLVVF